MFLLKYSTSLIIFHTHDPQGVLPEPCFPLWIVAVADIAYTSSNAMVVLPTFGFRTLSELFPTFVFPFLSNCSPHCCSSALLHVFRRFQHCFV